jgi:hypothetical protein
VSEPHRGDVWWAEAADVPKAYLVDKQCTLAPTRLIEACGALRAAVGC